MNLRDRPFEKSLWARVRRELRASPSLWKEYRRTRPGLRRYIPDNWVMVLVLFGLGAGVTSSLLEASQEPGPALAVIAFWFLGSVGFHTRWWFTTLYDGAAVMVLYHLPLTDAEVFRVRWRATWRKAVAWVPVYSGAGVALAMFCAESKASWLILFLLPGLHYVLALALALHLAAWRPNWSRVCLVGYAVSVSIVYGWKDLAGWVEPMVRAAWWVPPAGWLNYALVSPVVNGDWLALGLLIPIVAILVATPISWRRLRDGCQLGEPTIAADQPTPDESSPAGRRLGPTELADSVRDGTSLQPSASIADAGWLERWVYRWWTPRERVVAEFFAPQQPGWSLMFRRMIWLFLPALAVLLLFAHHHGFIVFIAILAPAFTAVPVLGGYWPGFEKRPAGGQYSPMFAGYPIGFGEALRLILKANSLRLAVAAPFLLALGAAASWRITGSVAEGLTIGFKALALYCTALPLIGVLRFSESTNDTNRLSLTRVCLLVPFIPTLIGGGAVVFMAETVKIVLLGLAIGAGSSLVLTSAYNRGWAKGRFDLLCAQADAGMNSPE